MKRTILGAVLISAFSFLYGQSLRESIFTVTPSSDDPVKILSDQIDEELKKNHGNYSISLSSIALRDYEKQYSGYAVNLPDGSAAVLTVYDAVKNCSTVSLKYADTDGNTHTVSDLPVIKKQGNYELAIVKLPDSFKEKCIPLITEKLSEGDDVYLPYYQKDMTYLLNKGCTGNNLNNGYFLTSFGSLISYEGKLIAVKSSGKYKACGILVNSDNGKCAGTDIIRSFLSLKNRDDSNGYTSSEAAAQKFISIFNDTSKTRNTAIIEIAELLDDNTVKSDYTSLLNKYCCDLSYEDKTLIDKAFQQSTIYGAKVLHAIAFYDQLNKNRLKGTALSYSMENSDTALISTGTKKTYYIEFKKEGNSCTIISHNIYDQKRMNHSAKSSKYTGKNFIGFTNDDFDNYIVFQATAITPEEGTNRHEPKGGHINAGFESFVFNVGMFADFNKVPLAVDGTEEEHNMFSAGFNIKALLPLRVWRIGFAPWCEASLGLSNIHRIISGDTFKLYSSYASGLELTFITSEKYMPYITAGLRNNLYNGKNSFITMDAGIGIKISAYD